MTRGPPNAGAIAADEARQAKAAPGLATLDLGACFLDPAFLKKMQIGDRPIHLN